MDGRNIWKTDLNRALETLRPLAERLGPERLMVGSSCSLLHSPVDLECETRLDPEVKQWMAFATQKCREVALLGELLEGQDRNTELQANAEAMENRRQCSRTYCSEVRERCAGVTSDMLQRRNAYPVRKAAQAWLNLPLFPTTTIGSFPQTPEIRKARLQFRKGEITPDEYQDFLKRKSTRS